MPASLVFSIPLNAITFKFSREVSKVNISNCFETQIKYEVIIF